MKVEQVIVIPEPMAAQQLNETARNMVDKEVTWNIGGWIDSKITTNQFYEKERGTSTGSSNAYPTEWSKETDKNQKYNGVGLIYPSDYGYATNGGNLGREVCLNKFLYEWDNVTENYRSECSGNDWLKPSNGYIWNLSPNSSYYLYGFAMHSNGCIHSPHCSTACEVLPTIYLNKTVTITSGNGSLEEPYNLG